MSYAKHFETCVPADSTWLWQRWPNGAMSTRPLSVGVRIRVPSHQPQSAHESPSLLTIRRKSTESPNTSAQLHSINDEEAKLPKRCVCSLQPKNYKDCSKMTVFTSQQVAVS